MDEADCRVLKDDGEHGNPDLQGIKDGIECVQRSYSRSSPSSHLIHINRPLTVCGSMNPIENAYSEGCDDARLSINMFQRLI